VRGAFDLDNGLVGTDVVVTVLEVEAEGEIGSVLEEEIVSWAVNDIINRCGLYKRRSGQCRKHREHR
jgi:hypothetical protein